MDSANPIMPRSGLSHLRDLPDQTWFNALWFQGTWFAAVIGREDLLPLTVSLILLHLALVRNRLPEMRQLALVALAGLALDCFLTLSGVFVFEGSLLVPAWLGCLWLAFATTLYRCFAFMASRPWLAAVLGATVVPFNYCIGARLGAVELPLGYVPSFAIMAVAWALLLPSLYYLIPDHKAGRAQ